MNELRATAEYLKDEIWGWENYYTPGQGIGNPVTIPWKAWEALKLQNAHILATVREDDEEPVTGAFHIANGAAVAGISRDGQNIYSYGISGPNGYVVAHAYFYQDGRVFLEKKDGDGFPLAARAQTRVEVLGICKSLGILLKESV